MELTWPSRSNPRSGDGVVPRKQTTIQFGRSNLTTATRLTPAAPPFALDALDDDQPSSLSLSLRTSSAVLNVGVSGPTPGSGSSHSAGSAGAPSDKNSARSAAGSRAISGSNPSGVARSNLAPSYDGSQNPGWPAFQYTSIASFARSLEPCGDAETRERVIRYAEIAIGARAGAHFARGRGGGDRARGDGEGRRRRVASRTSNECGSKSSGVGGASAAAAGASADDAREDDARGDDDAGKTTAPPRVRMLVVDDATRHRGDARVHDARGVGRASGRALALAIAIARAAARSAAIGARGSGSRPGDATSRRWAGGRRPRELARAAARAPTKKGLGNFRSGGGDIRRRAPHVPSSSVMAFWGLKLEPNKWTPFVPPPEEQLRLHVSQARPATAVPRRARARIDRTAADRRRIDRSILTVVVALVAARRVHPRRRRGSSIASPLRRAARV